MERERERENVIERYNREGVERSGGGWNILFVFIFFI